MFWDYRQNVDVKWSDAVSSSHQPCACLHQKEWWQQGQIASWNVLTSHRQLHTHSKVLEFKTYNFHTSNSV